jgi:hypothetical protein
VDVGYCTTRLQNTHRTEKREVLYLWHPLGGNIVQIHEVVDKASGTGHKEVVNLGDRFVV